MHRQVTPHYAGSTTEFQIGMKNSLRTPTSVPQTSMSNVPLWTSSTCPGATADLNMHVLSVLSLHSAFLSEYMITLSHLCEGVEQQLTEHLQHRHHLNHLSLYLQNRRQAIQDDINNLQNALLALCTASDAPASPRQSEVGCLQNQLLTPTDIDPSASPSASPSAGPSAGPSTDPAAETKLDSWQTATASIRRLFDRMSEQLNADVAALQQTSSEGPSIHTVPTIEPQHIAKSTESSLERCALLPHSTETDSLHAHCVTDTHSSQAVQCAHPQLPTERVYSQSDESPCVMRRTDSHTCVRSSSAQYIPAKNAANMSLTGEAISGRQCQASLKNADRKLMHQVPGNTQTTDESLTTESSSATLTVTTGGDSSGSTENFACSDLRCPFKRYTRRRCVGRTEGKEEVAEMGNLSRSVPKPLVAREWRQDKQSKLIQNDELEPLKGTFSQTYSFPPRSGLPPRLGTHVRRWASIDEGHSEGSSMNALKWSQFGGNSMAQDSPHDCSQSMSRPRIPLLMRRVSEGGKGRPNVVTVHELIESNKWPESPKRRSPYATLVWRFLRGKQKRSENL